MEEIDIKVIRRLSTGLLENVELYTTAMQIGETFEYNRTEDYVSADDFLALYLESGKNEDKMRDLFNEQFPPGSGLKNLPFYPEVNRIEQEIDAQRNLLGKLLGINYPKHVMLLDPTDVYFCKLRNLALAGLAVSKED